MKILFFAETIRQPASVQDIIANALLAINTTIVQIPGINEKPRLGYEVNILGAFNSVRFCKYVDREKSYLIIRTGTVLGEGMPKAIAASIFHQECFTGKNHHAL